MLLYTEIAMTVEIMVIEEGLYFRFPQDHNMKWSSVSSMAIIMP